MVQDRVSAVLDADLNDVILLQKLLKREVVLVQESVDWRGLADAADTPEHGASAGEASASHLLCLLTYLHWTKGSSVRSGTGTVRMRVWP